jgi:hypothetical protein
VSNKLVIVSNDHCAEKMKITLLVTMILITTARKLLRDYVATAVMCVGTYSEYLIMHIIHQSYMCGIYILVHFRKIITSHSFILACSTYMMFVR